MLSSGSAVTTRNWREGVRLCWCQSRESSLAQFGARLEDDLRQPLELSRTAVLLGFGRKFPPKSLLLHEQQDPMEHQQAVIVHGLNALDDLRTQVLRLQHGRIHAHNMPDRKST